MAAARTQAPRHHRVTHTLTDALLIVFSLSRPAETQYPLKYRLLLQCVVLCDVLLCRYVFVCVKLQQQLKGGLPKPRSRNKIFVGHRAEGKKHSFHAISDV